MLGFTPAAHAADPTRIEVWIRAFIPDLSGTRPDYFQRTPGGVTIRGPLNSGCYLTDGRDFSSAPTASSRIATHFTIVINRREMTVTPSGADAFAVGASHELNCATGAVLSQRTAGKEGFRLEAVQSSGFQRTLFTSASVGNPYFTFTPAPKIDYTLSIRYDILARTVSFSGSTDTFPAYEAYYTVNGGPVQTMFRHPVNDTTALNLLDLWLGLNTQNFTHRVRLGTP